MQRTAQCEIVPPEERKAAPLKIRHVRKDDRTCTAEIDDDCFSGSAEDFKTTRKTKVVVAVQAKVIVGYIRFDIEEDHIYLANVCVAPDARGENICQHMVRWLVKKLDHYDRKKIRLYATNDAAVACYERAGFKGESEGSSNMEFIKRRKSKKGGKKSKKRGKKSKKRS